MLKKRHKKGASGAVMVEFALAFPILLITFIFAIQLLFVFIYDILGSYAAYAAARSYSVFQDEDLAKGVAAAVMSSWTIPAPGEEKSNEVPPEGVKQFLGIMSYAGLCGTGVSNAYGLVSGGTDIGATGLLRYQTALERMVNFKVVKEPSGVFLKEGFKYEGTPDYRPLGWPFGWLQSRLAALGGFWGWLADKFPNGPPRYEAQMGHVSFSYNYTESMMFTRFSYLGSKASSGDGNTLFSIYQSCAMPIEPEWKTDSADTPPLTGANFADVYQMLLRDNNEVITNRLQLVHQFVKERMGDVSGINPPNKYSALSFEQFITNNLAVHDRLDRNRSDVKTWAIDSASLMNSTYDNELVKWQYVPTNASAIPVPLLVERNMSVQPGAQPNAEVAQQPVIDVLETLKRETAYRELVIRNIEMEIARAGQELNDLKTIRDAERVITAALKVIDTLEGYLNGKSGWEANYWYEAGPTSSSSPPANATRPKQERRSRSVPDGKGGTRTTYYYVTVGWYYKVMDVQKIKRAITDQQNIIAAAETRIAAAQGRINNFLTQEEIDFIRKNDTYNDNTVSKAQQRINEIIVVWNKRKEFEQRLITEDDAVRARFAELMNAALVPIADYYRIQKRILDDQRAGLDAVGEVTGQAEAGSEGGAP